VKNPGTLCFSGEAKVAQKQGM